MDLIEMIETNVVLNCDLLVFINIRPQSTDKHDKVQIIAKNTSSNKFIRAKITNNFLQSVIDIYKQNFHRDTFQFPAKNGNTSLSFTNGVRFPTFSKVIPPSTAMIQNYFIVIEN